LFSVMKVMMHAYSNSLCHSCSPSLAGSDEGNM